ncbi:unnamed protein product, partial [Chrysoparadoxa australica]
DFAQLDACSRSNDMVDPVPFLGYESNFPAYEDSPVFMLSVSNSCQYTAGILKLDGSRSPEVMRTSIGPDE